MKTSRRRSREFALQGLYQWQVAQASAEFIESGLRESDEFAKADGDYFAALLHGAIVEAPELDALLAQVVDRPVSAISPVEHAILLIGAYELKAQLEVPYRVVINEAVELAKRFGGTDGHKYVNGVLDRLAPQLRAAETGSRGSGEGAPGR